MRTLSAAEIYALSLLHCHHGYPLWKPKPYDSLPETYRRTGTNLGDVGRVTQDGHFHFLFNALVPADDPINRSGVPRNFEPLTFDANHVLECINYHEPGAPIYTVGTKRHDFAVDATTQIAGTPAEGSGGIELKFEETAGAVLLLPEGATRVDVETIIPFRQYAHTHCEEWYRFAEARGIEVENGSLYFVTGFDKTSSWENAAFSNPTRAASVSLKVVSGIGPGGRIQASQSANLVTPITRGHSPPNCGMNQSVFIRGFKITLRSTARYIFQSPIKVMDLSGGALKDLKPKDVVARGGPVMFNERRSSFSRSQSSSSAPASRNTSGRQGGSHLPSLQRSTSSLANSQRQSDFESLHSYTTFDSDTDLDLGLDSDKDCFEFEDIITKNLAMVIICLKLQK
ncbi:SCF ubiquitin ligase complex subunit cdc4 [Stygiomarasmius scandens]|uniref:SCF ubiquitin ligase complex subunit cdc4 n=1 Tax=Marasmiellus scandens TaxID=2682957 RepID=A0ABR1J3H4_9AGAR